ncbi:MAG TPA: flagellar hook-basal body complex protein FliE [Bryobacteraceae bacterium]|nr:flagellar hook-basal body complex protein FliE [Bryobacteraceae bacterium]
MPAAITPVSFPALAEPVTSSAGSARTAGAGTFQEALASAVQTVEDSRSQASASVERFLNGEGEELHTTILATERAQLTFDLFMQARNKVVSAYQEIMRMQM